MFSLIEDESLTKASAQDARAARYLPVAGSPNRMPLMIWLREDGKIKSGWLAIAITLFAIAVLYFGFYCVSLAGTQPHTYKIDYNVFYTAWQSVLHTGGNPYAEQISPATPYLYPPLFAQLFSPLGLLSVRSAAAVWYLIGVISLIGSLILSQRLAAPNQIGHRLTIPLILFSFVTIARFGLDNLRMGQINLLLVAITIAGLYLYERNYFWPAALVLATAISFKLTPGLFLIYFLIKGKWKFTAATGVLTGCFNLLSFVPMGRQAPEVFKYWYNLIIMNRQGFGWGYHGNQSWRALIHRLFTDENTGAAHLPHVNLTTNIMAANIAYYAGVLVIIGLIAWAVHYKRSDRSEGKEPISSNAVEYGLVFCGMLMISSLSWKDHYVALILPYAVLLNFLAFGKNEASKRVIAVVLAISFLLCTMTNMSIIGGRMAETVETFSAVFMGVVALFVGLLYVRTRGMNARTESEISNKLRHRIEERVQA